ncbi:MAG: hypothetical protein AAF677_14645 [Pseudomonadota bacterium]
MAANDPAPAPARTTDETPAEPGPAPEAGLASDSPEIVAHRPMSTTEWAMLVAGD